METVRHFILGVFKITADSVCSHEIKRGLLLGRKAMTNPRQHIKKQRHYFANKCPCSQSYGFYSSHVGIWELDYKESWALNNWCFWTVLLEKILESPLDCKEIRRVHPKGNQSWVFTGKTDTEGEAPILRPADAKNWHIGKDPDSRKDWRQEEKRTTEDEMVGWHHQFDWYEFEQAPGVGDGLGSLACYSPWGHKESDMTRRLINKGSIVHWYDLAIEEVQWQKKKANGFNKVIMKSVFNKLLEYWRCSVNVSWMMVVLDNKC